MKPKSILKGLQRMGLYKLAEKAVIPIYLKRSARSPMIWEPAQRGMHPNVLGLSTSSVLDNCIRDRGSRPFEFNEATIKFSAKWFPEAQWSSHFEGAYPHQPGRYGYVFDGRCGDDRLRLSLGMNLRHSLDKDWADTLFPHPPSELFFTISTLTYNPTHPTP